MRLSSTFLWLLSASIGATSDPTNGVKLELARTTLTLSNGYILAEFDLLCPRLAKLAGTSRGDGVYGPNMLVGEQGVRLEVQPFANAALPYSQSPARSSAIEGCHTTPLSYRVTANSSDETAVDIGGIVDDTSGPTAQSHWSLALRRGARGLELSVHTSVLVATNVTAIRLAMDFNPVSAYMLYDKGVLQMMNAPKPYYAAPPGNRLRGFYSLGGVGPTVAHTRRPSTYGREVGENLSPMYMIFCYCILYGDFREERWRCCLRRTLVATLLC